MAAFLIVLLAASAALYTLAAVIHLMYLTRRHFESLARWSTRIAWGVHSVGMAALVVHSGRMPVYTLFEFLYAFTWIVVSMYVAQELLRDTQATGAIVVPVTALMQIVGVGLQKPSPEQIVASYPASLISWHIGVSMLGYGFFVAASSAGALYLIQERNLRLKRWGPLYQRLPSLESLDVWGSRYISVGFMLLTIGLLAGLAFAQLRWVRWWLDPKVLGSLAVWLVYCAYLLMRKFWGWGGRKAAWWTVIGVVGPLINYFVINVLSRTHRFGV